MPKSYHFSKDQIEELNKVRKLNKNKGVEKRLKILLLRAQGVKRKEIVKSECISINHIIAI